VQGRRNPSLKHLTRIADALDVPLTALFERI
jgi:transcriptional regulator with XRE-family HTH domain